MNSLDAAKLSGQIYGNDQGGDVTAGLINFLFASGARADRFAKAKASGADLVCIDLEDSVPEGGKAEARAATLAAVADDPAFALRINPVATAEGIRDLAALIESGVRPAMVFVPKVESPAEVAVVRAAANGAGIVPLVETPAGLAATAAIGAAPGVAMMMFGGGDLSAELGVELAWEPLAHARGAFLLGCAAAGAPAIDVPWIALDDTRGLEDECRRARAAGFAAKAAIHPAQIATIVAVFAPTDEEIAEAHEAEAAFAAAGGAAARFRGRMLEAPVMRRYRRIIEQSKARGQEHA